MSTDKTLADVQPGGRVRLGDQAERAPWRSMDTCPRDGTVVRLRWGEDHVSPGWWSAPVSPVQNDDGTWPSDTGGFPWAFIDFNNGSAFVNHAVDTEYGPTHWAPYAALSAQPSPGGQGDELPALPHPNYPISKTGLQNNLYTASQMQDYARTALAASQPVSETDAYQQGFRDGQDRTCTVVARQPVGWQPMESAPTDGTVVLGLLEGSDIPQSIRFRDGWEIAWDGYRIPAHDGPLRWAPLYAATPAQQPAQVYLDGLDRALGEAIDQRDRYHEMADDLAGHIAAITGVDIGEHSSANCPWQNAIEAAEEYKPAQAVDLGQFRDLAQRWADKADLAPSPMTARSCSQQLLALIDSKAVGK
ncbi:hypothetical protein [Stenotrophomonas muris]|uniref:hypothetical protein n=1 Tax=Stenotrophomonas muris TaxID=2963283 RepID=UPI0039C6E306